MNFIEAMLHAANGGVSWRAGNARRVTINLDDPKLPRLICHSLDGRTGTYLPSLADINATDWVEARTT